MCVIPPAARPGAPANVEATAQNLVGQMLEAAIGQGASDIHVEPQMNKLVVRFRVDGQLVLWKEMPTDLHPQILSRLKIMASLDISEKRLPQDGRFSIDTRQGTRDFRLAVVPMLIGEKAVIRVLMQDLSRLDFNAVGYTENSVGLYRALLGRKHGLVLHTGTTGSGKTTALYAAINFLRQSTRNIQTVEDPVEGRLPDVNQAQVNNEIGLTFGRVLRGYLRQDCDVILIGEIRDTETAQLALQASLTGHLVLGTLHTNSAVGAVTRLVDMGIPHFLVAAGLAGVVAHRLVRKLCPMCRRQNVLPTALTTQYGLKPGLQVFEAGSCPDCGKSGFKGRTGIQEIFTLSGPIREAIVSNQPEKVLQQLAIQGGMTPMFYDGAEKAATGVTTMEEVYRAVVSDA